MRLAISIMIFIAAVTAIIIYSIPAPGPQAYTGLSVLPGSGPDLFVFTIENEEGNLMDYDYFVTQTSIEGGASSYYGNAGIEDGSGIVVYFPLEDTTGKAAVFLPATGQEITYETGRVKEPVIPKKEWKPEIVPDLPWERQDPIVRHFYRYVYDQSRSYETEGRA